MYTLILMKYAIIVLVNLFLIVYRMTLLFMNLFDVYSIIGYYVKSMSVVQHSPAPQRAVWRPTICSNRLIEGGIHTKENLKITPLETLPRWTKRQRRGSLSDLLTNPKNILELAFQNILDINKLLRAW